MGVGKTGTESNEWKKRMKIGFITPSLSECGGLQRVQTLLANYLSERHEVTVIVFENGKIPPYYELNQGIRVEYEDAFLQKRNRFPWGGVRIVARKWQFTLPPWIAQHSYYSTGIVRELQKKWREDRYDCLIASTAFCSILLGIMGEQLEGIKTIGWHHNSFSIYFQTPGKGAYIQKKLAKNVLKKLDALVTLTRQDKEAYKRWMEIDGKYIYNPLSFSCEKKSDVSGKTLLFVGRLEKQQKGLDFLMKIAKTLFCQRGHIDWKLEIVGDGSGKEELCRMIIEYGLEKQVVLVGKKQDVREYYTEASIFLCTSRWEGFGMVVTEAMECGLPVVSFKTDGPSEIICDGETGFLINNYDLRQFSDAVERLMENDGLRRKMAEQADI